MQWLPAPNACHVARKQAQGKGACSRQDGGEGGGSNPLPLGQCHAKEHTHFPKYPFPHLAHTGGSGKGRRGEEAIAVEGTTAAISRRKLAAVISKNGEGLRAALNLTRTTFVHRFFLSALPLDRISRSTSTTTSFWVSPWVGLQLWSAPYGTGSAVCACPGPCIPPPPLPLHRPSRVIPLPPLPRRPYHFRPSSAVPRCRALGARFGGGPVGTMTCR